jgi:hypothetical protein
MLRLCVTIAFVGPRNTENASTHRTIAATGYWDSVSKSSRNAQEGRGTEAANEPPLSTPAASRGRSERDEADADERDAAAFQSGTR